MWPSHKKEPARLVALVATAWGSGLGWARYQSLLRMWVSNTSLLSCKEDTCLSFHPWMALWTPARQSSHDRLTVEPKVDV
jgi:hypothetical protein